MIPLRHVPNALTGLRVVLAPVIVLLLAHPTESNRLAASGLFVLAASTDMVDGWMARAYHRTTAFGKLMDPVADKLLVIAILVTLASLERIAVWAVCVIVGRELAVTALRVVALRQGVVIPADRIGKIKTEMQYLMIFLLILLDPVPNWITAGVDATVVVTVLSGAAYFVNWCTSNKPQSKPSTPSWE